jgi:hypothetical protein
MIERTEKEQWEEDFALHCESMAKTLKNFVADWAKNPTPDNLAKATECAIKAKTYSEVASQLRIPYLSRKENEFLE